MKLKRIIKFRFSQNTKIILTGSSVMIFMTVCMVIIARALTVDNVAVEADDGPAVSAKIVADLRIAMNNTNNILSVPLQAYIIPETDAHQNRFVSSRDDRVGYVTGIPGLIGTIAIQETVAVVWVQSRYYSQVLQKLDNATWTVKKYEDRPTIIEWLLQQLPKKSIVGVDPMLVMASTFHSYKEALAVNGHQLEPIKQNLVDLVWYNRPMLRTKELEIITTEFSGRPSSEKMAEVRKEMERLGTETFILSNLDEISWLLNLRGSDIEYSSMFYAYVIVMEKEVHLYLLDEQRITDSIKQHFQNEGIFVTEFSYKDTLTGINRVVRNTNGKVLLPSASEAIRLVVPPDRQISSASPIGKMKTLKNEVEANGMREASIRDSIAVIQYFHWLEDQIDGQNITELKGVEKLKSLKSQQQHFRRSSCATVSAFGEHAALGRYIPTLDTDIKITRDEVYLLTGGAHYMDGTTFVARSVHFGTPSDDQKDAFTRVLKGFISAITSIFPPSAPPSFFDAMARSHLWDVGLDYEHDTSFGIGSYQNLHRIPEVIGQQMFITIGPGYYEENKYGVRIGDVLHVVDLPDSAHYFEERGACHFNDITMVPIQAKMINTALLTPEEIEWFNAHHRKIRETIQPHLEGPALDWLIRETEPLPLDNNNS